MICTCKKEESLELKNIIDSGPFYHGTKAKLNAGDFLKPGFVSNYDSRVVMNHIYFTATKDGAGFAAQMAVGSEPPRVYLVEPMGKFEDDPNVTDKKFPGNPTRSYRSTFPLKVIEEVKEWNKRPEEDIETLQKKIASRIANEHSKIIN